MNWKWLLGIALLGIALCVAALAAPTGYKIVINAQMTNAKAIVIDGKTYVPLEVFKALGVNARLEGDALKLGAGGANQRDSLEGCIDQPLFNGVWRLRVLKLQPVTVDGLSAWGVTVELRNGTKKTQTVFQTGIDTGGKGAFLNLQSGDTLSFDALTRDIPDWGSQFAFKSLPPGGGLTYQMRFYTSADKMNDKPSKFLLEIDPKRADKSVKYALSEPSFRVRLDCTK
jgi:hypothetical protein